MECSTTSRPNCVPALAGQRAFSLLSRSMSLFIGRLSETVTTPLARTASAPASPSPCGTPWRGSSTLKENMIFYIKSEVSNHAGKARKTAWLPHNCYQQGTLIQQSPQTITTTQKMTTRFENNETYCGQVLHVQLPARRGGQVQPLWRCFRHCFYVLAPRRRAFAWPPACAGVARPRRRRSLRLWRQDCRTPPKAQPCRGSFLYWFKSESPSASIKRKPGSCLADESALHFTFYTLHTTPYPQHFTLHHPHFIPYTLHSPLNTPLLAALRHRTIMLCRRYTMGCSHGLQHLWSVSSLYVSTSVQFMWAVGFVVHIVFFGTATICRNSSKIRSK